VTARRFSAALVALVLGFGSAGFATACNDRENTESGNPGQKDPEGGISTQATDPGATIAPEN
jgi:hypothetical protein